MVSVVVVPTRVAEFDAFYEARLGPLTRALYLGCGSRERAEDCAQEAFIRAWQRWRLLRSSDPVAWVRTTAWRLCVDDWRASERTRRAYRAVGAGVNEDAVAWEASSAAVLDLLGPLTGPLRAVVVLHYVDDLTVDEISRVLGVPSGTVKSRLSRARDDLRKELVRTQDWIE